PVPSRDRSERMLRQFGAQLVTGERSVTLTPGDLHGTTVSVPGDISSAAFLLVAATMIGDPGVTIHRVGVNPTRTGVLDVLEAMSARLRIEPAPTIDEAEPAADLRASASELKATSIGGALIPRLIDEIPVLAVAGLVAEGETVIEDTACVATSFPQFAATLNTLAGTPVVLVED